MQFAKQILESKAAYKKFKEIIEAQGGSLASIEKKLQPAKLSFDVKAEKKGIVEEISNKGIAALARAAGCPSDKAAGCYLHVHVSKKVQKGDLLITIYAETEDKLGYAKKIYQELQPIKLK
jgi:AMP phosphorylase